MAKFGWKFEPEYTEVSGGNIVKVNPVYGTEVAKLYPIDGSISASAGEATFTNANVSGLRSHADGSAKLVQKRLLPNGAQGQNPTGGFTCTGLFKLANGNWLVGNDGRTDEGDATFSPSVVELSPEGDTIVNELDMSSVVGDNSVQGVIEANDGSYWIASPNANTIYSINSSTGAEITSFAATGANGLAYNSADNVLYWCSASSSTVHVYDIDTTSEVSTLTITVSTPDQLFYKDGTLYITQGSNGDDGNVYMHDVYDDRFIGRIQDLPACQAIEGIVVEEYTITIANDGGFHTAAYPPVNALLTYQIDANIPQRSGFLGVHGKLTLNGASPAQRSTFVTYGKPFESSTGYGWAVYFMDSDELRVQIRDPDDSSNVYLAEWAITRGTEFTFDVYIDIDSDTVYCEIDGVDQGAPVTTVGTLSTITPQLRYTFTTVGVSQEDNPREYPLNGDVRNCFVSTTLADFNEVKAFNQSGDTITSDFTITATGAPDGEYLTYAKAGNIAITSSATYSSESATVRGIVCPNSSAEGYVIDNESPHVDGAVIVGATT